MSLERSPGELSEDDETREYQEYSSNEDVSDVEPLPGDDDRPHHRSRKSRSSRPTFASRVRNDNSSYGFLNSFRDKTCLVALFRICC